MSVIMSPLTGLGGALDGGGRRAMPTPELHAVAESGERKWPIERQSTPDSDGSARQIQSERDPRGESDTWSDTDLDALR